MEPESVTESKQFSELGLSPAALAAVAAAKYITPSPIQAALIPIALTGADCVGQARTGTGKTAAFMLPILDRVDSRRPGVQALVLTPTRELSEQVSAEAQRLAVNRPLKIMCCVGGKNMRQQIKGIEDGAQVVIGTPGRVIDLNTRGMLNLQTLQVIVLDEADRMLDIGFRPDIERILRKCPTDRQTLLLSATLPPPVERLAQRYMRSPQRVDLSSRNIVVETIDQYYITCDQDHKFAALVALLLHQRPRQSIVFCRTKRGADRIYSKLGRRLPSVAVIHGDLAQSARDRAMKLFREGKIRLLVATDVVGRGIDVTGVSHIVNYDVPEFCDDYIHRVGRTGRLSTGEAGSAFTLVTPEEGNQLTSIEKRINRLLPKFDLDYMTVLERIGKAVPASHRRAVPKTSDEPKADEGSVVASGAKNVTGSDSEEIDPYADWLTEPSMA